ncbi:MAG: PH domain-containing protein [Clostridia bacterium]|nr:PH domain-containing protein [Clostridia bacterium]
MGKYVENNLGKNEVIVKKADLNGLFLFKTWLVGILFFWLLLIPLIKAIIKTIKFSHIELAVTNKRVVGKVGVFNTKSLDAPLNKVQNASVTQKFFGKVFNYGIVNVSTAAGEYHFDAIKNPEAFKGLLMAQIDQFEEDRMKMQATQMAQAMASAINK